MNGTEVMKERVDSLNCGMPAKLLRLIFPVFVVAVVLQVGGAFANLINDWDYYYSSGKFDIPEIIGSFFTYGLSALVCCCLLKGLESKSYPMKWQFTTLAILFGASAIMSFFSSDPNPNDLKWNDIINVIIGLSLLIVGLITVKNLKKYYSGPLERVGQVVYNFQFVTIVVLVAIIVLLMLLGFAAYADYGSHSDRFSERLIIKIIAVVIIGLISSAFSKRRKEKDEVNRALDAAIAGEDIESTDEQNRMTEVSQIESQPESDTDQGKNVYRAYVIAIIVLSIIGFVIMAGTSEVIGVSVMLIPMIIGFVGSMIYAMRLVTRMLVAGAENGVAEVHPQAVTPGYAMPLYAAPVNNAAPVYARPVYDDQEATRIISTPNLPMPPTSPAPRRSPSKLLYWLIGVLSVVLLVLIGILVKNHIDKNAEREAKMMMEQAERMLGQADDSRDADAYASDEEVAEPEEAEDVRYADTAVVESYDRPYEIESRVASETEFETSDGGTGDMGFVGNHTLEGYVNGEYSVTVRINVSSSGKVTGKYAYHSTLEKYGDKSASWIKIKGQLDGDRVKLAQDCPGVNEPWPAINATLSWRGSRLHLTGDWYHTKYYSIDAES